MMPWVEPVDQSEPCSWQLRCQMFVKWNNPPKNVRWWPRSTHHMTTTTDLPWVTSTPSSDRTSPLKWYAQHQDLNTATAEWNAASSLIQTPPNAALDLAPWRLLLHNHWNTDLIFWRGTPSTNNSRRDSNKRTSKTSSKTPGVEHLNSTRKA